MSGLTVTATGASVSMLPLSSTARLLIVTVPVAIERPGVSSSSHGPCRVPGRAAVDRTSTPPTRRRRCRTAVPVMVTVVPTGTVGAGRRRGDGRGRRGVSVDWVAATKPGLQRCRLHAHVGQQVYRRLLHAGSGVESPSSWLLSRPHDHWTVPAPNTSAPLVGAIERQVSGSLCLVRRRCPRVPTAPG